MGPLGAQSWPWLLHFPLINLSSLTSHCTSCSSRSSTGCCASLSSCLVFQHTCSVCNWTVEASRPGSRQSPSCKSQEAECWNVAIPNISSSRDNLGNQINKYCAPAENKPSSLTISSSLFISNITSENPNKAGVRKPWLITLMNI